ncbi:hypothetical protein [Caldithrix abyssi]
MENKKLIWWTMILLGILGGILFFPLPIDGKFTCFFHRMALPSQTIAAEDHGKQLVDYYVHRFSFFWWGSLLLVSAGIYLLNKKNNLNKQKGLS